MNDWKSLSLSQKEEVEEQFEVLSRGTEKTIPDNGLKEKLIASITSKTPLRVKLGLDPSAPDVHIGHTVVLHKLRQFQHFGHIVQLVIGDFTGRIGDPTGKSATRKQLTDEEVKANATTYFKQFGKVIDMEKAMVDYNSTWLAPLHFADVIRLASQTTVARMLERDDFEKRYRAGQSIAIHEFFYPLMQAYDSVALKSDIELGGTDQTFNLLMGRHIQESFGLDKQVVMTLPLLEGLDGVKKMSKSLGNYIGIDEDPKSMFGKAMSIPDNLMVKYFTLVTDISANDLEKIKTALSDGSLHPRDAKLKLAWTLVRMYHGESEANEAKLNFLSVFQKHALPEHLEEVPLQISQEKIWIIDLLVTKLHLFKTNGEARRMILAGGIKINQEKINDVHLEIKVENDMVIQVGKRRFLKIRG
ncbi:tyrosine--tRNA ligase [Sporolactobacillus shoreae]|uniref:Tyrosine--tRNA ligase n=1 Tax=Sporolactobacillus shoreae TaxID=1465501 RepID=A0A4Z0GRV4_9BACL|nr:tyrosine--tRNA ligase [Sporolactobacillus shoreae]TGA98945.1 tyrosine--tRNA ligase [Sporolactobacillus shoreae]